MTASVVKSVSVNNHVSVANFAFCITHCLCGYVNKFLIQIISVSVCNSVSVGNHVSVVNSVSISNSVCAYKFVADQFLAYTHIFVYSVNCSDTHEVRSLFSIGTVAENRN